MYSWMGAVHSHALCNVLSLFTGGSGDSETSLEGTVLFNKNIFTFEWHKDEIEVSLEAQFETYSPSHINSPLSPCLYVKPPSGRWRVPRLDVHSMLFNWYMYVCALHDTL